MKLNEFLKKLKHNKLILGILIIGIVLLVFPFSDSGKEEAKGKTDYEETLAKKTEEVLSLIEGAGKVKVMLTLDNDGTTYPVTEKSQSGERAVSSAGKLAVSKEEYPKVRGVAVVASGADVPGVREDIINAVRAVTGAPLCNIQVFKMK